MKFISIIYFLPLNISKILFQYSINMEIAKRYFKCFFSTKSSKSAVCILHLQQISVQTSPFQVLRVASGYCAQLQNYRQSPRHPYFSRSASFVHNCLVHLMIHKPWTMELEFGHI